MTLLWERMMNRKQAKLLKRLMADGKDTKIWKGLSDVNKGRLRIGVRDDPKEVSSFGLALGKFV